MKTAEAKSILTADIVKRKLRRMAFEIAERNAGCESLLIAGIAGNGEIVARNLLLELAPIIDCKIATTTIHIDKTKVLSAKVDDGISFNNETVIVVDDVANSGKTLLYSLRPVLAFLPKAIQTLVLVERSHKLFPIQIDFVGLSLSTTLQEHITIQTEGDTITGATLH